MTPLIPACDLHLRPDGRPETELDQFDLCPKN